MKIITIIFLFLMASLASQAQEAAQYSIEIPQELGQQIEEFSLFKFGRLEDTSFSLVTTNDNLLHGGGQVLGLKPSDNLEGDDLGQTFEISIEALRRYENAELSIEFFSSLYSRLSPTVLPDGSVTVFAENGKTRTENISNDGAIIKLKRNIKNKYFLVFETELSYANDKPGVALFIQDTFHYLARNLETSDGFQSVQYEVIEHAPGRITIAGAAGVGKTLNIFKNKNSKLSFTGELGLKHSNTKDLQAAYINTSLDFSYKSTNLSLYRKLDTKLYDEYGLDFDQKLFNLGKAGVLLQLGISKEDNRFTVDFPDQVDSVFGSEINRSGDFIYKYGIEINKKF